MWPAPVTGALQMVVISPFYVSKNDSFIYCKYTINYFQFTTKFISIQTWDGAFRVADIESCCGQVWLPQKGR
jgi:hypothetical protein